MNELLAAYRYTTNNWAQIGASRVCGCCNCVEIFKPDEIVGWTGLEVENINDPKAINEQTAMCPHCGSVLDPKLKQHLLLKKWVVSLIT